MRLGLLSFTPKGALLGQSIFRLPGVEFISRAGGQSASAFVAEWWNKADGFVFIGAAGIAVRCIAPLVRSKASDPAVVVLDESGRFAVPILSGHLGGANQLAKELAALTGGQAVLTTATDVNGAFAVDVWSGQAGCTLLETSRIKAVSGALLRGEPVGLYSEFPVQGALPPGMTLGPAPVGVCVSLSGAEEPFPTTLHAVPRIVTVGAGCRRNTAPDSFEAFVWDCLGHYNIAGQAVCAVASIDRKADEACLLAFCRANRLPFLTYSAEQLRRAKGVFSASAFVEQTVGVDNVCERSAVMGGGSLRIKKQARDGMTMAAAVREWRCCFEFIDGGNGLFLGGH